MRYLPDQVSRGQDRPETEPNLGENRTLSRKTAPLTTLAVRNEKRTPVFEGILSSEVLDEYGPGARGGRAVLFVDETVWEIYHSSLKAVFERVYSSQEVVLFTSGESAKTWDSLQAVLHKMSDLLVDRRGDALFAIGGGSILDLVGFAASIYRRGVPLTKIPTSLMGQIDAAIGLKNAINFDGSKNLVGSFTPPHSVIVDFSFLNTLPRRHISNGIAEIVKLGLVLDNEIIRELVCLTDTVASQSYTEFHAVFRAAICGMVDELNGNPYEAVLSRSVDFGHWLSPQLEMCDESLLHGEAVSIDMAHTLTLAMRRGILPRDNWGYAMKILSHWKLPLVSPHISSALVKDSLDKVIRHRGGSQNIPLCVGFGEHVFVCDITVDEVMEASRYLSSYDRHRVSSSISASSSLEFASLVV